LFIAIQVVHSLPQFFGQSFSSSSFVNPSGQVVSSSIYTDSQGNRIVSGAPQNSFAPQVVPQAAPQLAPNQAPVTAKPVAAKPAASQYNTGQYVHDDSGKYKGN